MIATLEDNNIRYIYWELSNYCNLQCKHCFSVASTDPKTIIDKQVLFDGIERVNKKMRCNAIRFGGGEPLLVPFLPELIAFCVSNKINVDITTNGILLNHNQIIKLFDSGLREITVSVDGLQNAHDYIRGKGNFSVITEIINELVKIKKGKVSIAFTVTCQNYLDIIPFLHFFIEMGIEKYYFFRYCGSNNFDSFQLSKAHLFSAAKAIQKAKEENPQITIVHEPLSFYPFLFTGELKQEGCNFLNGVLTINYKGDVLVCAGIPKKLGNIYFDNLDNIVSRIKHEKNEIKVIPSACGNCVFMSKCHGGCKANSFSITNSYSLSDSLCYHDLLNNLE